MSNLGNKEIFAKNLNYYMSKFDITRNEICDALNFKYSTFTEWANGTAYPRIDKIEMLANYFNIKKSDLIEDRSEIEKERSEDEEIMQAIKERPDLHALFRKSINAPKEDILKTIRMIEVFKDENHDL